MGAVRVRLEAYDTGETRAAVDDIILGTGGRSPGPRKITKQTKREWRVRHSGRRALRKGRDRRRRHTDIIIEGAINSRADRTKLDYLSRKDAAFKLFIEVLIRNHATYKDAQRNDMPSIDPDELIPSSITGSVTTTGDSETLTASAATFQTSGVQPGDLIYNTTDGSWADVLGLDKTTPETKLYTSPLKDGTDNTWTSGDGYKILKDEDIWVVIDNFNCWAVEGKTEYYEYTLTLKRTRPPSEW